MNDLESQLRQIHIDIMKDKSYMAFFHWNKANEKCLESKEKEKTDETKTKEKEKTDETKTLMAWIFSVFVDKTKKEYNKLHAGKMTGTSEILDKLENNLKEILETIDSLKNYPEIVKEKGNNYINDTKESIKEAQKLVQVKREFADIWDQQKELDKSNFSWQAVKEIWEQTKKRANISRPEWLAKAAEMSKEDILVKIAEGALSLVMEPDEVPVNGYPSTHEELDFLQEIADEFPKTIDKVIREREGEINKNNEGVVEMKKANEQLKSFIQEQRKKLGSSGSTNKPNSQDQQKIQSLQNEINSLKQTITELQAQIAELKQNQNKDNSANPEITKKIEALESQKQQIQSELSKKQSQVNQEKNKSKTNPVKNNQQTDNSQQSNNQDNKFNWLYVVIPGAVLLVVIGVVVYLMSRKKDKK
ncbi:hypothetical protein [endosymbiont GvMRE of Glomus versiforme]|uniref:hypothetical protein n=1 Tax=endosymbiont GvMRE of Glomus versiforme TaxID=2039283 RepID=UPI000EC80E18|nr:hypothetical protein [endosymbiont GvMRE of Glomus versiforme]RHZ36037.1 hypothetical protein GvMRE_Ic3g23 [endosymbiont GvMRE of Glomus versiforme]